MTEVQQLNGSGSPWKRAGSSSGRLSGENLYLFLSSKLTSSLRDKTVQSPRRLTIASHPCQLATAGVTKSQLKATEAKRQGITNHKRARKMWNACVRASVGLCLAEYHLPHTHSCDSRWRRLTLPGVSSTSDKGQTDSRRARVHTGQPAAGTAGPLSPSSTENQGSDSQSQACFWWCNYITFRTVNIRTATPTANKFINFWVTVGIYCTHDNFYTAL